jgi:hypothetical protein
MKRLLFVILLPLAAFAAGPFSIGLKGGLPMTGFINTVQGTASTVTNEYIVGPEAELHLPFGFGIEFDALYRHFRYTDIAGSASSAVTSTGHAGAWEFPLVAKYKLPGKIARPYVEGGVAWDTLMGVQKAASNLFTNGVGPAKSTVTGIVLGAGLDIHAIVLHIAPEIRYTRWTSQHYNSPGVLSSNENQAEFLVGFTF